MISVKQGAEPDVVFRGQRRRSFGASPAECLKLAVSVLKRVSSLLRDDGGFRIVTAGLKSTTLLILGLTKAPGASDVSGLSVDRENRTLGLAKHFFLSLILLQKKIDYKIISKKITLQRNFLNMVLYSLSCSRRRELYVLWRYSLYTFYISAVYS